MAGVVDRTVVIVPPWTRVYVWPFAEPDDALDYALDATAALAEVTDTIVSASASVFPSGAGELTPSQLSFTAAGVLTVWLSGGVAGRTYFVQLNATTAAGRTFSWYVKLPIDSRLAANPIPPPTVAAYSTPITAP